MVIIHHCEPETINPYATSPLTEAMTRTLQHGVYNGSQARFGNPSLEVTIHDRSDFHGISHYELRNILDREGSLDQFLIIDAQTPENDAVWYVPGTEECRYWSDPALWDHEGERPIRYPDEDFILWQGHLKTADVPVDDWSYNMAATDLELDVETIYSPYDPHDPQEKILTLGIDWTSLENQSKEGGFVSIRANWSEVEWATDTPDWRKWMPVPPVVARLKAEVATQAGLVSDWESKEEMGHPGEEVDLTVFFDWNSPLWPHGFPDDGSNGTVGRLRRPIASEPVRGSGVSLPAGLCRFRNHLREGSYKGGRLVRPGRHLRSNGTRAVRQQRQRRW